MKSIFVTVVLMVLAGCNDVRPSKAIDVHCDPLCEQQCEPLTGWDGDRDGDRLTAIFNAHDVEHAQCEAHRKACQNCINAARAANAIK